MASPPKPDRKTPRLPAPWHQASWGWRKWVMVAGYDHWWWCLEEFGVCELCPEQLFPVWELAVGKTDLAVCTRPNGLMVESDALSQSLKGKTPERAEVTELRAMKGSDERRGPCCWMTQPCFKCLFFCSLCYWSVQSTDRYQMQFSAHSVATRMWILILKGLMCREREGAGNLDCIANILNKIDIK